MKPETKQERRMRERNEGPGKLRGFGWPPKPKVARPAIGDYKIIGIAGSRVVEGKKRGAPGDVWLTEWGKKRGCSFVARYWPSKKGWIALDIRNAQIFDRGRPDKRFPQLFGAVRSKVYPTEDAVVMRCMAILDIAPVTS